MLKKIFKFLGSCALKASVVKCQLILLITPSIDILIDILIDTRLTLSWHSWTFDQQLVDSQPSVDHLICIDQKLADSQPTVNWDVNQLLLKCQPRCRWSVDRGYQSRVWIDTQPQMPLLHMIQFIYSWTFQKQTPLGPEKVFVFVRDVCLWEVNNAVVTSM